MALHIFKTLLSSPSLLQHIPLLLLTGNAARGIRYTSSSIPNALGSLARGIRNTLGGLADNVPGAVDCLGYDVPGAVDCLRHDVAGTVDRLR